MKNWNRLFSNYVSHCSIDICPQLLDADGQARPELFMEDKLHLNWAGYDQWAAAISPVLLKNEAVF